MKIFNVMFSKRKGGLEQAFLDYTNALSMHGYQVISIIHPKSHVKDSIKASYVPVHNFNKYDILAIHRLSKLIAKEKPNCIITHGARANTLIHKTKTETPIITVCHSSARIQTARDGTIAITNKMRENIIQQGENRDKVYLLHNMLHFPDGSTFRKAELHNPVRLGVCARLVHIKGIDLFIEALNMLKQLNIQFEAVIAGEGEEKENLIQLVAKYNLQESVSFIGWVDDKDAFYSSLDILVTPSRIEAFGLVTIEAMKYSLPIIASRTEGSLEILTDRQDALLVNINSSPQIVEGIKEIINNEALRTTITQNAFNNAQKYSIFDASRILQRIVEEVCFKRFY